ncbi:hypothetical protein PR002_g32279 [Phytophthora rubi]|uniref:Uncharacterized protein n=2 Tax=Phytophthora rubi TaxID=129364 RepID=A0A6A3GA61_9STRA|nr:hypothetical protein PR002_g32279 [Phytophthora rubi]
MQHRMNLYSSNGTPADFRLAAWLQSELTIRRHILTLPAPPKKSKKRKTVPVGGRILTVELMKEIEADQAKKKGKRKKPTDILEEALV